MILRLEIHMDLVTPSYQVTTRTETIQLALNALSRLETAGEDVTGLMIKDNRGDDVGTLNILGVPLANQYLGTRAPEPAAG